MNHPTEQDSDPSPTKACGECGHSFRKKFSHDTVVCVPHLKSMPTDHCEVCELHKTKEKKR